MLFGAAVDGFSWYRLTLVTVGEIVLEISIEWLLAIAGGSEGLLAFEFCLPLWIVC